MDKLSEIMHSAAPLSGVCGFDALGELVDCRAKARIPAGAKSVITAAFPYYLGSGAYGGLNVSKYAAVRDYHDVLGERLSKAAARLKELYPGDEFACFADNSPVPEVRAAYLCGLGIIGKNGLLITKEYGSFVFIGEIVTTLDLPRSSPAEGSCLGCGMCAVSCPAKAIDGSGVSRGKCLSAVTQKKGALTGQEEALIKANACAWGCDVCQNVCPHNKGIKSTEIAEFISSAQPCVTLQAGIAGRAFAWRGEETIKRNLGILK